MRYLIAIAVSLCCASAYALPPLPEKCELRAADDCLCVDCKCKAPAKPVVTHRPAMICDGNSCRPAPKATKSVMTRNTSSACSGGSCGSSRRVFMRRPFRGLFRR